MYLCPSYWNKEGLNQRIKIKVYKHDVLCFVCTLQPKYQGAHVRETLQGVTSFSQVPHVLILIDFLLWDSYLSVTLSVAAAVLVTSTNFMKSSSLGKISSCTMPLIFTSSARGRQTKTLRNGHGDAGAHWEGSGWGWVYQWIHVKEWVFLRQDSFCSLSHGEQESNNVVSYGGQSWVTSSAPLRSACPCSCSQVLHEKPPGSGRV